MRCSIAQLPAPHHGFGRVNTLPGEGLGGADAVLHFGTQARLEFNARQADWA